LCKIVEEILSLERVGIHDDFFRIGGDSILSIQLMHNINEKLKLGIEMADILRFKNIKTLAEVYSDKIENEKIIEFGEL